jgi:hypothetical protein
MKIVDVFIGGENWVNTKVTAKTKNGLRRAIRNLGLASGIRNIRYVVWKNGVGNTVEKHGFYDYRSEFEALMAYSISLDYYQTCDYSDKALAFIMNKTNSIEERAKICVEYDKSIGYIDDLENMSKLNPAEIVALFIEAFANEFGY